MTKCERKKKTFNAKLFVRILPTTDISYESIKLETNRQVLYVRCLQDVNKGMNPKNPNYWSFCTDGVFWNSSQSDVFDALTSDWYDDVFDGISGLILSYGQTGSGKTFTTSGLRLQYQNRGLILRLLSRLFHEEEQRRDFTRITFGISYLEFMGDTVRDLITGETVPKIKVPEHSVRNEEWAWKQIFNAECRKSYSEEAPYSGSNRGHSVLTFYIHTESLIDTDPIITHSKIHVVDMAGIGGYGKSASWKTKSDVGQNNLSKCLMEQLIICLTGETWKGEGHICPYKSSKFLMFLHDTLQPHCLIRFVAHVYGNEANLPVTISTLKFGEKVKALKPVKLERILESNYVLQMKNLERECLRLREEAELADMLKDSPGYCDMSQARLLQIKRAAEEFLHGRLENLTLLSFGQAAITLETFRELYFKLSAEKDQMIKEAITSATEMLQSQLVSEKMVNSSSPAISNTQRMSRRRSRQQDSQLTFGASFRSTDSNQLGSLTKSPPSVQQVGYSDRKGISIGPGRLSTTFEGNITKAFKKLKTRRSDSLVLKTCRSLPGKDVNLNVPKNQVPEDVADYPLPQCIPSRESAWSNFCSENPDMVCSMKSNVENHEDEVRQCRKKYTAALAELTEAREKINELKMELENCRHIRRVYERDNFEEDANLVPGEPEREIAESLTMREEQLNALIENCHVALIDLKALTDELNGAKRALEEAFQEYCKTNYKIVFLPEEIPQQGDGSEGGEEESPCESDPRNQAFVALYLHLQQKLLNYIPKREKKEWKKY